MVRIPDLYADTNNDGTIGAGDVLYSLVDLPDYLNAVPTFNFGDIFSVVNGAVPGLQGMYFSSTDFSISATADKGFNYTPYTGTAMVKTDHSLAAVPEPSTLALVSVGLGLLLGLARKPERFGK